MKEVAVCYKNKPGQKLVKRNRFVGTDVEVEEFLATHRPRRGYKFRVFDREKMGKKKAVATS